VKRHLTTGSLRRPPAEIQPDLSLPTTEAHARLGVEEAFEGALARASGTIQSPCSVRTFMTPLAA